MSALSQTHFVAPVPVVLARTWGLLHGPDIAFSETRSSAEQWTQLADGTRDLAVTATDNVIVWNRGGADVRIVAQVERTTPLTLFARTDVTDIASLGGRRFAVDALDNGFSLAARHALHSAGVQAELVEVGGVRERLDALLAGEADASLLGPPFDVIARDGGLTDVARIADLLPGYPGQSLVVSASALREKRSDLVEYLRALATAVKRANTEDDATGEKLLRDAGFPLPAAAALWRERPRSLRVADDGLAIVQRVREDLGELPAGWGGWRSAVDSTLLDEVLGPDDTRGAR